VWRNRGDWVSRPFTVSPSFQYMGDQVYKYVRVTKGLADPGILVPEEDVYNHVEPGKPGYKSIYFYKQEHYDQFKKTGTIAGITDVKTNNLIFDFDCESDLEKAKKDVLSLVRKLHAAPNVYFSGLKGFGVEIKLDRFIDVNEFKAAIKYYAGDLETFDPKISNPSRIIRLPNTMHEKSGLYKISIPVSKLAEVSIDTIKKQAATPKKTTPPPVVAIPANVFQTQKREVKSEPIEGVDWTQKPRWLSNCRFALQQGLFKEGNRNSAFLCLAATYKNQGFTVEHVYRLLKGVAELQAKRNDIERYPDEELWTNVCMQVFGDFWNNGQFSCRTEGNFLYDYCRGLSEHKCSHTDDQEVFIEPENLNNEFKDFALNIDKNTIKLGIPLLDEAIRVTTSTVVGLLGAPSSAKSTVAFRILNHNSKSDITCACFSLDMGLPLVYMRLLQMHTGKSDKTIYDIYRTGSKEIERLEGIIQEEYGNVRFSFKSGMKTEDIKNAIVDYNNKSSDKIKLVVVDYLECINSEFSDPLAGISRIVHQLKDIANQLKLCIVLLLQPQKHAGDPSDDLLSYRKIKGSSAVEQALSQVITISRPGFSPETPENDKFIKISTVKNRMGSLNSFNLKWEGLTGRINQLTDEERDELRRLIERRKAEKKDTLPGWE
jgi:hypothetical protein